MSDSAQWYVIHTYSGYENKVAADLEKIIENRKLGDMIFDIRVPTEKVIEKNDKGVEKEEINTYENITEDEDIQNNLESDWKVEEDLYNENLENDFSFLSHNLY